MKPELEPPVDVKLQLSSEEIQEIMTDVPSWLIRWGITSVFILLAGAVIASWWIKYPEIVVARITITSQSPPARLVAKMGGSLEHVYVKENQWVERETVLAALKSSAKTSDVLYVKKTLTHLNLADQNPAPILIKLASQSIVLGELQPYLSALLEKVEVFQLYQQTAHQAERIKHVYNQISYHKKLGDGLKQQSLLLDQEVAISQKKYDRDNTLLKQGVIAEADFENTSTHLLQMKHSLENARLNAVTNSIKIADYEKSLLDLNQQFIENKAKMLLDIRETAKQLLSRIHDYEQRYLFITPVAGRVSTYQYWTPNQFINAGEELLAVVPSTKHIAGRAILPEFGAGRVEVNQKVRIKLDNYDFREYGIVEGIVKSISLTTKDNAYYVDVALPNQLRTTFRQELPFRQEMKGSAELVTKDIRLLERIFYQFRSLLDRKPKPISSSSH